MVSCDVDSASIRRRHLAAAPGTSYTRSHGCGVQHGQSTSRHLQRNKKADLFPYADMRPLGRKNFFFLLRNMSSRIRIRLSCVLSTKNVVFFVGKGAQRQIVGLLPNNFFGFLVCLGLKTCPCLKKFQYDDEL